MYGVSTDMESKGRDSDVCVSSCTKEKGVGVWDFKGRENTSQKYESKCLVNKYVWAPRNKGAQRGILTDAATSFSATPCLYCNVVVYSDNLNSFYVVVGQAGQSVFLSLGP